MSTPPMRLLIVEDKAIIALHLRSCHPRRKLEFTT
jgi:hypothetical protein